MRTHRPRRRPSFALVVAVALLATARTASAQQLVPVVGTPIAYEIGIPADWKRVVEDGMLEAGSEDASMMVMTVDLLAGESGQRPTGDELQLRQERIQPLMTSDSLFLEVVTEQFVSNGGLGVSGMTREMGTLGGERAAHVRGRTVSERGTLWFQTYVTIRAGILYIVVFNGFGEDAGPREPLFVRIRESFRLPATPPSPSPDR